MWGAAWGASRMASISMQAYIIVPPSIHAVRVIHAVILSLSLSLSLSTSRHTHLIMRVHGETEVFREGDVWTKYVFQTEHHL